MVSRRRISEQELDKARERQEETDSLTLVLALPAIVAAAGGIFSDRLHYSPYLDVGLFRSIEGSIGTMGFSVVLAMAYSLAVLTAVLLCSWGTSKWLFVSLNYLGWAWFFVALLVFESARLAFSVPITVAAVFFTFVALPKALWAIAKNRK